MDISLTVVADNSKLPNSRWYSGSGIYRPVWLYVGEKSHIAYRGMRITTLSVSPAKVKVETKAAAGQIAVEILDGSEGVARRSRDGLRRFGRALQQSGRTGKET